MIKNTKRAMAAFINLAAVVPTAVLNDFLVSHGQPATWDLTNAKVVANTIGADKARTELETIRAEAAAALAVQRRQMLETARTAWVNGDSRAFDKITW